MRIQTLVFLVCAAGSTLAWGQNALGDGRALERRLEQTGAYQGNVPRPDFRQEIRMRNAIVTGNAGGGKAFKGNVSFGDPDDFRGSLGSDSLFRFRRDSFGVGGSANVGLRGTESLQYQYAFSTGNASDTQIFSRSVGNTAPSTGAVVGGLDLSRLPKYDVTGADQAAPELGTLRSTASFTANRGLSPALVGYTSVKDGVIRVTASSLQGVRGDLLVPDVNSGKFIERSKLTLANAQPALGPETSAATEPVVKTAYELLRQQLDTSTGFDRTKATEKPPAPTNPPGPTSPTNPTAPANPLTPSNPTPDGQTPGATTPATDPTQPKGAGETTLPAGLAPWEVRMLNLRRQMSGLPPLVTKAAPLGADGLPPLDDETRMILRSSGSRVSSYVSEGATTPLSRLLKEGQEAMARGDYFDAEERFARALAIESGEPSAMAGRVNAQLGAGLYVSAAINLRQLFEQHPETIGIKYEGSTAPLPKRLDILKRELRGLVRPANPEQNPRPEGAILLAYVGYQTGDAQAVTDGLAGMRDAYAKTIAQAAQAAGVTAPPDHLVRFLQEAWAAPDTAPKP